MKIINLPKQTNHSAIEVLKETLRQVEDGEIMSVGVVYVDKNGNISGDTSYTNNGILMWAAFEHMAKWYYDTVIREYNEIER